MRDALIHEALYRTPEFMERIRKGRVVVCGAGALGGNIVENLVRQGYCRVSVIDFDKVEERNNSTQPFSISEVGYLKSKMLAFRLFRDTGREVEYFTQKLNQVNAAKFLRGALIIDAFDNHESRMLLKTYCAANDLNCFHVGISADGTYSEGIWNETYVVPADVAEEDVCNNPMARNLVMITIGIACERMALFIEKGEKVGFQFTFKDFKTTEKR